MKHTHLTTLVFSASLLCSCDSAETTSNTIIETGLAAVTAVTFSGTPGNYTFNVTVQSPDSGCDQYADWWEVVRADGTLAYRRVLLHSHVDEQPFTRSGGPVNVTSDETIFLRAHMNNSGYSEQVFSGSIDQGFAPESLDSTFAVSLSESEPLPVSCAF